MNILAGSVRYLLLMAAVVAVVAILWLHLQQEGTQSGRKGALEGAAVFQQHSTSTPRDYSFRYPAGFNVMRDPDDAGRLFVVPADATRDNFTGAVVITARTNALDTNALDWLASKESGYDISLGYNPQPIPNGTAYILFDTNHQLDWVLMEDSQHMERVSVTIVGNRGELIPALERVIAWFAFATSTKVSR